MCIILLRMVMNAFKRKYHASTIDKCVVGITLCGVVIDLRAANRDYVHSIQYFTRNLENIIGVCRNCLNHPAIQLELLAQTKIG